MSRYVVGLVLLLLSGCFEGTDVIRDVFSEEDTPSFVSPFPSITRESVSVPGPTRAPPDVLAPPTTLPSELVCSGDRAADDWPARFARAEFLGVAFLAGSVYAVDGTFVWTFTADLELVGRDRVPGHPIGLDSREGRLLVAQLDAGLGDYPLGDDGRPIVGAGTQWLTHLPRVLHVAGHRDRTLVAAGDQGVAEWGASGPELLDVDGLTAFAVQPVGGAFVAVDCDVIRHVAHDQVWEVVAPGAGAVTATERLVLVAERDLVRSWDLAGTVPVERGFWVGGDDAVRDVQADGDLVWIATAHTTHAVLWSDTANPQPLYTLDAGGSLAFGATDAAARLVVGGALRGDRAVMAWTGPTATAPLRASQWDATLLDGRFAQEWTRFATGRIEAPDQTVFELPPGLGATVADAAQLLAVDGAGRAYRVDSEVTLLSGDRVVADAALVGGRAVWGDVFANTLVIDDGDTIPSEPGVYLGSASIFAGPGDKIMVLDGIARQLRTYDAEGALVGISAAEPCDVDAGGPAEVLRHAGRAALFCPGAGTLRLIEETDGVLTLGDGLALPDRRWVDADWSEHGVLLAAYAPGTYTTTLMRVDFDTGEVSALAEELGRVSAVAHAGKGAKVIIDGRRQWRDQSLLPW